MTQEDPTAEATKPEIKPPSTEEVMALLAKVSLIYAQTLATEISDDWDQHSLEVIITQKTETVRLDAVIQVICERLGIAETEILLRMAVLMKREMEEMTEPRIALATPHGPRQNGRGKLIRS